MTDPSSVEPPFEIILPPEAPPVQAPPVIEAIAPAPSLPTSIPLGAPRRRPWISVVQTLLILSFPVMLALLVGVSGSLRSARLRNEPGRTVAPAPVPAAAPVPAPEALPPPAASSVPTALVQSTPPALAPLAVAEGPVPSVARPQDVPPAPAAGETLRAAPPHAPVPVASPAAASAEAEPDPPETLPVLEERKPSIPLVLSSIAPRKTPAVDRESPAPEVKAAPEPPRADPREVEADGLLAQARSVAADQPALGAARYRKVLELLPTRTELWKTVADLDLGRGALDDAAREYREYLRAHPGKADALQNLGVIQLRSGRREEARVSLEAALQAGPTADLYYDLGNLHLAARTPAAAVEAYRRAIQYDPGHVEAKFNLALALERAGQKAEAVSVLAELGSVSPEVARVRARIEATMGGVEADRALTAARASADAELVMSAASGFRKAGELEKALALSDRAVELAPQDPLAYLNRGALRQTMGRIAEAVADYEEASRLNPSLGEARFNLGVLEEERGQYVSALNHYREALRANPTLPCALNNVGALYLKVGQPERAAECFRRCLESDPAFSPARLNLAWASLAQGLKEDTRDELARYVALVPKEERDPEALRVLSELGGVPTGGDSRK